MKSKLITANEAPGYLFTSPSTLQTRLSGYTGLNMQRWVWALIWVVGLWVQAQSYQELDTLAAQLYQKGDYRGALETYQKSLHIKQNQLGPDHLLTALAYSVLGNLYSRLNQYPQALEHFRQAQQIYEKKPPTQEAANNFFFLGDAYTELDNYPKALESYDRAQILFDQLAGSPNPQSAQVALSISFVQIKLGNLPKALEVALQATRALEQTLGSEHGTTALAYETVAEVYGYQANPAQQLEFLQRALSAKQKSYGPQHPQTAWTLLQMGQAYRSQKKLDRALDSVQLALQIYQAQYGPEHPLTAENQLYLANIHADLRDYPKAAEILQQSITALLKTFGPESPSVATRYILLGQFYHQARNYPKALETYSVALKGYEQTYGPSNINTAQVLSAISTVHLQLENYAVALENSQKALRAFLAQQALTFEALDNQDKLQYKQFNRGFAGGVLLSAVLHEKATLEQKQSVLDDWLSYKGSVFAFENGIGLLQQQASPALKTRLEEYLDLRHQLARLYTITPADVAQAKQIQSQISEVTRRLSLIERELSGQTQAFASLLDSRQIGWAELARGLGQDELYLDYGWFDDAVYVLSLDAQGSVEIRMLVSPDLVSERLAQLRKSIEQGQPLRALLFPSQELYRALLAPLEAQLSKANKLLISPDGPLAFLPFELLSDGKQLLLERFSVRYIPSGRDLLQLRRNPAQKPTGPAAIFGNPVFTATAPGTSRSNSGRTLSELLRKASFAPLPATEREAKTIGGLLGNQTQVFLGEAANQQNLQRLESPRVLHLATHGFFLNAPDIPNPFLRVGIALSGARASVLAGEEYGLLTALQLSALQLSGTELVVLSACETALGDVIAGEGVIGLNQAFIAAGARRVMLSLWKVPDQETALLMENFYRLWTGGKTVEEALRQAKLELMRQGLEPIKWAAFVLSGE